MCVSRLAVGLIGAGRDRSVDEAIAECIGQGLLFFRRGHAVCFKPQSVNLGGARGGDPQIVF